MADLVNENIPQNAESPTLGAQRIRETRAGFNDLLGAEHDISDDAQTGGFHGTNVTGKADTAITDPPTGYGRFGWKVVSGVTELFYRDDAGNEKQITSAGKLVSQLQDTDTDLSEKSYFLDQDDMSGDDPLKVASQQSIKAYIDAQVAAAVAGIWNPVNLPTGTNVYNSSKSTSYQDLDLSSVIGSNSALVYLRLQATDRVSADFRINGETLPVIKSGVGNILDAGGVTAVDMSIDNATVVAYLAVIADSSGIVEWRAHNSSPTISVNVVGYIK